MEVKTKHGKLLVIQPKKINIISELAKAEIIARGPAENVWFLNPMVCFNGDRVTFAKTYVRKRKTTTDDPNQLTIDFKEEQVYEVFCTAVFITNTAVLQSS